MLKNAKKTFEYNTINWKKIKLRATKDRREDGWENEQTPYLVMPAATTFSDDNLDLNVYDN